MQNNSSTSLSFENDSNLRGIQPNVITNPKPDSYYLAENNKIVCQDVDKLVHDDNFDSKILYCYNNGDKKKLVEWKNVNSVWTPKYITHSSEYKEINGSVCKVISESCDSNNPYQGCQLKCFLDDLSTKVYTANFIALPKFDM